MKLPLLPGRWWIAAPVLFAAVGLSWLLNRPVQRPVTTGPPTASEAAGADSALRPAAPTLAAPESPAAPRQIADIFAVRTWEPPPPPPAAEVAATPQAPPLPFTFIGRITVPGKGVAYMLARDDQVIVAGVGDSIGKDYRIEKFEKGQLLIRYRPMNIRQSLPIGGAPS